MILPDYANGTIVVGLAGERIQGSLGVELVLSAAMDKLLAGS